jgi:hypothetical protein
MLTGLTINAGVKIPSHSLFSTYRGENTILYNNIQSAVFMSMWGYQNAKNPLLVRAGQQFKVETSLCSGPKSTAPFPTSSWPGPTPSPRPPHSIPHTHTWDTILTSRRRHWHIRNLFGPIQLVTKILMVSHTSENPLVFTTVRLQYIYQRQHAGTLKGIVQRDITGVGTRLKRSVLMNKIVVKFAF